MEYNQEGPGATPPVEPEDVSDFGSPLLQAVARQLRSVPVPAPGQRLGGLGGQRYEVRAVLGSGGMGRVFRAWDDELHRLVALKFLLPEPGAEAPELHALLGLLREEAKSIARLDHENIVRIHDVAEWDTGFRPDVREPPLRVPFLVMEYLEGESLLSLLRRGAPGLRRSLDLLVGVASGLAHAHARGVVHLDLKPGNVFILGDGRVKLLDFGLARLTFGSTLVPGLRGGGTPAYMAPEQWRGEPLSARTDVWAAGLLLFELLVGAHPLPGVGPDALRAHVGSARPLPSVRERRPELPEEVAHLVEEALAPRPEDRPENGGALLARLRALEARLAPGHGRPGMRVAERWLLTVVSCLLGRGPEGAEAADGEDTSELEAGFQSVCARIIRQHGGMLATCVGAEVQACFGYPMGREDTPMQAVRAALRLREVLPRELSSLPSGRGLAVRVGVHTDVVTVADAELEPHGMMPAIRGEAPRVAAWLATQAPMDAVVLSDRTHALVRGAFLTRSLGAHDFPGLLSTRPLAVHEALRERRGVSRFDRARAGALTPLVGRERELRALVERCRSAFSGQGVCVLLVGEAGIGKSRLVRELYGDELALGAAWARCQCWPSLQGSAFAPLVDWLQGSLELLPDAPPLQRRERLEAGLEALGLFPEQADPLAAFLSLPVAQGAPFLQLSVERQRERVLEGLGLVLRRMAARTPLVFLVEDVHWADPSTLQFLDTLVGHLEGVPLCLLLTARPEFTQAWEGRPGFHALRLERLAPEGTVALARAAAGERSLPEDAAEQLVARTDGVPLFIEELTRMLLAREARADAASLEPPPPIPLSLHGLLRARLDPLPPPLKALVQQAATLGREFRYEMLRGLSFLSEDELLRELDALERAGLLCRHGEPPAVTYAFQHALVQDAAYQSMPREMRQRYHARVVQVLRLMFPDEVEERLELLAWHATQAGLTAQAVDLWRDAGHQAEAKSAFPEAIHHFTQALSLLRRLPASRERDQREIALQVSLGMAFVSAKGFAAPEVEATYTWARALCERFGDVPLRVLWGVWVIALVRADREGTDELAARFERMLVSREDPVLEVVMRAALAARAFWRGELAECQRQSGAAKATLAKGGLRELPMLIRGGARGYVSEQRLNVYLYRAWGAVVMGRAEQSRADYLDALALAEMLDHPYAMATVLIFGSVISHERGDARAARDEAERAQAFSIQSGFPFNLAIGACLRGWALAKLGEVEEGLAMAREGLDTLKAMGAWVVVPLYAEAVGCACLLGGRVKEGLEVVREGRAAADAGLSRHALPELWRLEGELLRREGDEAGARDCFTRALRGAHEQGALLHELRAALALGRLSRSPEEERESRARVSALLDQFQGEDRDLEDCREARGFLATVPHASGRGPG